MLKCVKIEYNEKSDRFEVNTLFTKDMGHIFISGMMLIKNTYHTVQFNFDSASDIPTHCEDVLIEAEESRTSMGIMKNNEKVKVVYQLSNLNKVKLDYFKQGHSEASYKVAGLQECLLLYNPDMILQIEPQT